jgi:hypothetical protein
MNSIEEKLWNYIDGTCPPGEYAAIGRLIETDEVYRQKYEELLLLNAEFKQIELDEPSMAFTYNVMEAIRNEHAQSPLKAKINSSIIKGIGLFFILTISAVLIYILCSINWSAGASAPEVKFTMPNMGPLWSNPYMKGFWFFDLILALYLFDGYLRKKSSAKNTLSVQNGGQAAGQ